MPRKLIVAYSTQPVELDTKLLQVDFGDPPKTYKKPAAIAEWKAGKKADFEANLANKPYTGTFSRIWIADPKSKELAKWRYRAPDSGKAPVCVAARNWILKRYPNAWPNSTHPVTKRDGPPPVIFIGFNPRLFLKMLGLECSLPGNQPEAGDLSNSCPLSMWYTNTDHRDVGEAAKPKEFDLPWSVVLSRREITAGKWTGPGKDVEQDMVVATELATQLGFLAEE